MNSYLLACRHHNMRTGKMVNNIIQKEQQEDSCSCQTENITCLLVIGFSQLSVPHHAIKQSETSPLYSRHQCCPLHLFTKMAYASRGRNVQNVIRVTLLCSAKNKTHNSDIQTLRGRNSVGAGEWGGHAWFALSQYLREKKQKKKQNKRNGDSQMT